MESLPCCNSVAGHQIAAIFSNATTAVVPCTKFCCDHCIRFDVWVKQICIEFESRWKNRQWNAPLAGLASSGGRPPLGLPLYLSWYFIPVLSTDRACSQHASELVRLCVSDLCWWDRLWDSFIDIYSSTGKIDLGLVLNPSSLYGNWEGACQVSFSQDGGRVSR